MKRFIKALGCLAMAVAFVGCGEAGDADGPITVEPMALEVDHYRVPCDAEGRQLCFRVREPGGADWTLLYDGIEGFDYTWGRAYVLRIWEKPVDATVGAAGILRLLDSVEDEHLVRQRFELELDPDDLSEARDADFALLGEKLIDCGSPEVCTILRTRKANGLPVTVALRHGELPTDPAIAFQILR